MASIYTPCPEEEGSPLLRMCPAESPRERSLGAAVFSGLTLFVKIGSNLVVIPIALRYLSREEYAVWIIFQSMAAYFLMFSDMGLGQTLMNLQGAAFARADYDGVSRILTTGFGLYWLIVTPVWILSSIILFTQPVDAWLLKDGVVELATVFKPYLFIFITLTLARVPLIVFPSSLLGLREIALRQVSEMALAVFLFAGVVGTLVAGGKLLALILVTSVGLIVTPLVNYLMIRRRHPRVALARRFWTPAQVRFFFHASLFFFLFGLGLFFQRLAGNALTGKLAPLEKVPEMYILMVLIRVAGWSLADIISRTLQPYVIMFAAQGRWDRVLFFARLCTKCSALLAVAYSVSLYLLAEVGLRLWVGPRLFLGYGPLGFLAASFVVEAMFLSTNNFMIALNRHRGLAIVMVFYAALSFAFGVMGAWWTVADPAYGLCIGFFAASILAQALPLPWITNRWLGIGWRRYSVDFLFGPVFLACAGVFLAGMFRWTGVAPLWHGGLASVILLAILPVTAWILVFQQEERSWILALIRRIPASASIR